MPTKGGFTAELNPIDLEQSVSIKRCHGLGNVICLLPVLDYLSELGWKVKLITRPEWSYVISILRPGLSLDCLAQPQQGVIDLDDLTEREIPVEHRTDEFARLLGIERTFPALSLTIPARWKEPYQRLAGSIIFAPEGGHSSRCWPIEQAKQLKEKLPGEKLVLVGLKCDGDIPCDEDLRGQLELHELLGVLSQADTIITMDSAILHLGSALGVRMVAIFGGINPAYRLRPGQDVLVLQAKMDCLPCNKQETCGGRYDCIRSIKAEEVAEAVGRDRRGDSWRYAAARFAGGRGIL